MVSPDIEIAELNYQIRRKQTELEHAEKYLKHRQKTGLMTEYDEKETAQQQTKVTLEIADLEKKIRKIQNEQRRSDNMRL